MSIVQLSISYAQKRNASYNHDYRRLRQLIYSASEEIGTWFLLLCLVVTNHSMLFDCNCSSEEHRQIKRSDTWEAHPINAAKYNNQTVNMFYGVYCIYWNCRMPCSLGEKCITIGALNFTSACIKRHPIWIWTKALRNDFMYSLPSLSNMHSW